MELLHKIGFSYQDVAYLHRSNKRDGLINLMLPRMSGVLRSKITKNQFYTTNMNCACFGLILEDKKRGKHETQKKVLYVPRKQ